MLDKHAAGSGYFTRPRSARSRGAPSGSALTVTPARDRGHAGSSKARKESPAPEKRTGGSGGARGLAKAPHAAAERAVEGNTVTSLTSNGTDLVQHE